MRPVLRGPVPTDDSGDEITFSHYNQARDPLIDRMGDYCSYCEIALPSAIAVEHVQPKSLEPALELKWDNFLLACNNCNSVKLNTPVDLPEFYWPDLDNTLRAFLYEQDEPPQIIDDDAIDQVIAQRTIDLTGLDRLPGHPNYSDRDRRWKKRFEAWSAALLAATFIEQNDSEEMRALAVEVARGRGFWSVWFTVFFQDLDMCERLIAGFKGTASDCFDAETETIARPGGQI